MKSIYVALLITIFILFSNCIVVKEKDEIIKKEIEYETEYIPAQKSKIKMSDKIVRTEHGDMVASIPDGWFFIEPEGTISSEVFAIAVSPNFTLSAVFSRIKKTNEIIDIVDKEGIIGLARASYSKHTTKNFNATIIVDNYHIYDSNSQDFVVYSYTKLKRNTFGKSAVFISSINEYYEFSLVTMDFTSNDTPTTSQFDDIFYSILTTLKY
ncbi:MAG: hypothetical protein FWG85_02560 [Bacteroidetes bacterium]|nr:hypothetical protein [Bacteroidota bacterium]